MLADDEVAAICSEFLAESDNVASTTTFAIYLVCTHLHVRDRVVAEIDKYYSIHEGSECDAEGKPTFEDLDQFPYIDQVICDLNLILYAFYNVAFMRIEK